MNERNIVLVGPPRSGTTLCCWLLNRASNTLALHEPVRPGKFVESGASPEEVQSTLQGLFDEQRRLVREQGIAFSKHVGGEIPTDPYESDSATIRKQLVPQEDEWGYIPVNAERLGSAFPLVVKDIGVLAALLPALIDNFECYAVIRNPLSTLSSWNSVDHFARNGRSVGVERHNRELSRKLAAESDRLDRQLALLEWWFTHFARLSESGLKVIRYEDTIETGGRALFDALEIEGSPAQLSSRNLNPAHDGGFAIAYGHRLLDSHRTPFYEPFYPRFEVRQLFEQVCRRVENSMFV